MPPTTTTATLVGPPIDLDGVSAASGLEITFDGTTGYVIGDDSVLLYELDLSACKAEAAPLASAPPVVRRLRIANSRDVGREERIPKKVKHDFEAVTLLPWVSVGAVGGGGFGGTQKERLVVFGSGSKAGLRDSIAVVDPKSGVARTYNATSLMTALRADKRVTGSAALNLEAAASLKGGMALVLFNRGNVPGGRNSVVLMMREDFLEYLNALERAMAAADGSPGSKEDAAAHVLAPKYAVVHLELPPIAAPAPAAGSGGGSGGAGGGGGGSGAVHYNAGVSGASTVLVREKGSNTEYLLIAASYEATLNEIDDGAVLGSRLALVPSAALFWLAMQPPRGARVPSLDLSGASALVTAPPAGAAGGSGGAGDGGSGSGSGGSSAAAPVVAKIEGAAVRGIALGATESDDDVVDVLAVTDPDGGASQLLQVQLRVPVARRLDFDRAAAGANLDGAL